MSFNRHFACMLIAGALSFSANAHEGHEHGGDGPPPPPPQAYEDCKGKSEGDKVEITTPRGDKVSATCSSSDKGLFARPEHPPKQRGGKEGGEKGGDGKMPPPRDDARMPDEGKGPGRDDNMPPPPPKGDMPHEGHKGEERKGPPPAGEGPGQKP